MVLLRGTGREKGEADMSRTFSRLAVAGAFAAGLALTGLSAGPAAAQADLQTSVLAGSCASCHGTDGHSPGAIPPIAGRPEAVLRAQLQAFKAGETPDTTVMTRIAKGFSDEQIEALARHFSSIKK